MAKARPAVVHVAGRDVAVTNPDKIFFPQAAPPTPEEIQAKTETAGPAKPPPPPPRKKKRRR